MTPKPHDLSARQDPSILIVAHGNSFNIPFSIDRFQAEVLQPETYLFTTFITPPSGYTALVQAEVTNSDGATYTVKSIKDPRNDALNWSVSLPRVADTYTLAISGNLYGFTVPVHMLGSYFLWRDFSQVQPS